MSQRELDVGSVVHFAAAESGPSAAGREYRIEQLLWLDGATLYKIKADAEPFDRVVTERDLTRRT